MGAVADRLVVLIGRRRYQSAEPMQTAALTAFIAAMERYATTVLGVDPPKVGASGNGEWIKFEFEMDE
jgi:hypothetical protein